MDEQPNFFSDYANVVAASSRFHDPDAMFDLSRAAQVMGDGASTALLHNAAIYVRAQQVRQAELDALMNRLTGNAK